MLFADAYHFSKLGEEQMPKFISDFMDPIGALANAGNPAPLYRNTWGDGLFFVFESVGDAGRFALQLADRVALIEREAAGLPPERATHANLAGSLLDAVRGRPPQAPGAETHGIPELPPAPVGAVMLRLLLAEARFLARPGRRLPYGHTLLAVAGSV